VQSKELELDRFLLDSKTLSINVVSNQALEFQTLALMQ